jgi:hypothetical protein
MRHHRATIYRSDIVSEEDNPRIKFFVVVVQLFRSVKLDRTITTVMNQRTPIFGQNLIFETFFGLIFSKLHKKK